MSFWNIDGEDLAKTNGQFENDGGDIEPIPDGTQVLALIDEAKWDTPYEGDEEYISLRWTVMQPAEFKNRKIFQKLWVMGNNPRQADAAKAKAQGDKAKKMLAAIDHNAGGKLLATGEAPTDDSMTRTITNKPMVLKLRVWEMEIQGELKKGNWIAAVSPRNKQAAPAQQEASAPAQQAAPVQQTPAPAAAQDDMDDSIPF
jgi:hypothetical protein